MSKLSLALLLAACFANAEKIVILGDSLSCGPFGIQLVKNLTGRGNIVSLYCAVSSTPESWILGKVPPGSDGCHSLTSAEISQYPELCPNPEDNQKIATYVRGVCESKMPTFNEILRREGPARYVIALGANSVAAGVDSSYPQMAAQLPDCAWISPPHFRPDQTNPHVFSLATVTRDEASLEAFTEILKTRIGRCSFIDSRPLTLPGEPAQEDADETVDGVHRTNCSGKIWADKLPL